MSFFNSSLSSLPYTNTQVRFQHYAPKLAVSKPTKAKRKMKKKAFQPDSQDKKSLGTCAEDEDTTVILEHARGTLHSSSTKPSSLSDAATSRIPGNEEAVHPSAAAVGQDKDPHKVRDKASVVPRGTHVTESEGTNTTADSIEVLEIVSTSDRRLFMEKPAVTEDSSQTPINYDVEKPISCQDTNCQLMSSGDYWHDMYEDLSDIGTFTPSLFDVDNYTNDTPTSDSCSISATSKIPSERALVSSSVSHVDRDDGRLEKQVASNGPKLSPTPVADGCILGPIADYNVGFTSSTQLIVFDPNGRTDDAEESRVRQESLQSSDESNLLLMEVDQFQNFGMTRSRDEGKQNDVVVTEGPERELEAPGKDESDRYEIERIVDHDEHNGRKRYFVKWCGWSAEHMTWEPEGNLDDCSDTIKEYWTSVRNSGTVGNTSASRCAERKRKVSREEKGFSNEDEEYTEAYLGAEMGIEDREGEGKKRIVTRKRRRRHCRGCKETGHNYRTCPTKFVDINN